jgi:hypothetical protein
MLISSHYPMCRKRDQIHLAGLPSELPAQQRSSAAGLKGLVSHMYKEPTKKL